MPESGIVEELLEHGEHIAYVADVLETDVAVR